MHRVPCDLPMFVPHGCIETSTFRCNRNGDHSTGHQASHETITHLLYVESGMGNDGIAGVKCSRWGMVLAGRLAKHLRDQQVHDAKNDDEDCARDTTQRDDGAGSGGVTQGISGWSRTAIRRRCGLVGWGASDFGRWLHVGRGVRDGIGRNGGIRHGVNNSRWALATD